MNRLSVRAFAMTAGLLWGAALFFMTWWVIALNENATVLNWLSAFYRGYDVSPVGSLIGLAWALPDGAICGAFFAWLYNRLIPKLHPQHT